MSEKENFPSDYRDVMVTLSEDISVVDCEGPARQSVFRCVEVSERDDVYTLFQPSISTERDNDVLEVSKDIVRGILYMSDTSED